MKRSEINKIMQDADDFIRSFGFLLPPFAYWSVDEFRRRKADAGAILKTRLGWDITDYGRGRFNWRCASRSKVIGGICRIFCSSRKLSQKRQVFTCQTAGIEREYPTRFCSSPLNARLRVCRFCDGELVFTFVQIVQFDCRFLKRSCSRDQ